MVFFYRKKIFFFLIYIVLRLVYENISRIAVKISYLWGPKYGIYAAGLF